jgi:hypothetical protein
VKTKLYGIACNERAGLLEYQIYYAFRQAMQQQQVHFEEKCRMVDDDEWIDFMV